MKSMSRSTISANSNSSNSSVLGVVLFTNDDTSAATTMDNLVRHDQQQPHTTLRAIVSAAANGSGRGKVLLNTTTATPTTTTTSSNSHGHSSKIGNNSVGNSIKISKPGNGRSSTVIPRRVSTASSLLTTTTTTSTGGSEDSFPIKLHRLLTEATETGDTDVVGWNTEGTAFTIFQPKVFSETWMKRYFNQSRYKSFQRQCNLYNFERQNLGKVKGHYSHDLFLRNQPQLCEHIKRDRAPGTALQKALAKSAAARVITAKAGEVTTMTPPLNGINGTKSNLMVPLGKKNKKEMAAPSGSCSTKKSKEVARSKKKATPKNKKNAVGVKKDSSKLVSPTGNDTGLFERQTFTFDNQHGSSVGDDATMGGSSGGIPEFLFDPLGCFPGDKGTSDPVNGPAISLDHRPNSSISFVEEDKFNLGILGLSDNGVSARSAAAVIHKDWTDFPDPMPLLEQNVNEMDSGLVVCDDASIFTISDVEMVNYNDEDIDLDVAKLDDLDAFEIVSGVSEQIVKPAMINKHVVSVNGSNVQKRCSNPGQGTTAQRHEWACPQLQQHPYYYGHMPRLTAMGPIPPIVPFFNQYLSH